MVRPAESRAMRDERYITRQQQYTAVYEGGSAWVSNLLVIRSLPNGLSFSRYGFSISRRVGKAVVRNRMRRRIREILRQVPVKPGWDIVVIARVAAAAANYAGLRQTVLELLARARLLEENEDFCLGTN